MSNKNPMGEIIKIQLRSNCICYGPEPDPDDEIEQLITLTNSHIWITRYKYGKGVYERLDYKHRGISTEDGTTIIKEVGDYFGNGGICEFVYDVGDWKLKLINRDNKEFIFSGSLIIPNDHNLKSICDDIRDRLQCPFLFLFDGGQ